jgi:hypothetical protein
MRLSARPLCHMRAGDGAAAAAHLLEWSTDQRCPAREAFTADVVEMFRERCDIHCGKGTPPLPGYLPASLAGGGLGNICRHLQHMH